MKDSFENPIVQWDLYKSYGEFNFLFEDTIQEFRQLLIELIRTSYEYFEEEDENENELKYTERDRLLKILLNNIGASEIVECCKASYIDFFSQQKKKFNEFKFKWFDEEHILTEQSYNFALEVFKKALELVKLRNIIIHAHYSESLSIPEYHTGKVSGQKDVRTSKGYERRAYTFDINFFEKTNQDILELQFYIRNLFYFFALPEHQQATYSDEFEKLKQMNFKSVPEVE
jgi:hypothetical protein